MHHLDESERRENVVTGGDQRRKREAPLEPNAEVYGRYKEGEKHCDDRIARQLVSDAGTDSFRSRNAKLACPILLIQHTLDLV